MRCTPFFMRKICEYASGLLFLVGWLAPNHYFPWPSYYNELLAALGLLVLVPVAFITATPPAVPSSVLPVLLLCLVPIAQYFFGKISFGGDAWMASLYLAGLAVAFVTGYRLSNKADILPCNLAWVFVAASILSAGVALQQWLGLHLTGIWTVELPPEGRPYGNLAQPNNLALLLFLGVLALLWLWQGKHLATWVVVFAVLFLVFGIALTRSRASFVEFAAVLVVANFVKGNLRAAIPRRALLGCAGAFVGAWFLVPAISDAALLNSEGLSRPKELGARAVIWQQLLDAALNAPWTGFGWNQVSVAQVSVAASHHATAMTEHSHNLLLDLIVWNGFPLGIAIATGLGYWLYRRLRDCPSSNSWFGLAAITALISHSMLEFPVEYAYFLLPAGLLAGMVEGNVGSHELRLPRALLAAIMVGLSVILGVVVKEYAVVENDHRQLRFEGAGIAAPHAAGALDVTVLSQLREFLRFARTEAKPGMTKEEIEWMEKVAHRFPFPPSLFRYSIALALNDRIPEARVELIRLRRLHEEKRYIEAQEALLSMSERYPKLRQLISP